MAEPKRLPDRRKHFTHKAKVGNQTVHFSLGLYEDGTIGEIFIDIAKAGTALRYWSTITSMLMSICIQYRVPLEELIDILQGVNSEPFSEVSVTGYSRITKCTGIFDFVIRVIAIEFLGREDLADCPANKEEKVAGHVSQSEGF